MLYFINDLVLDHVAVNVLLNPNKQIEIHWLTPGGFHLSWLLAEVVCFVFVSLDQQVGLGG